MICPQCGYDIGNKNKCLRCGYEVKNLVVSDGKQKDDKPETKVIDPDNVYISSGTQEYYDPFDLLFGNIFDPIGDLLGGLFGLDVDRQRSRTFDFDFGDGESEAREKKKKGNGKVVEVNKVEIIDDDGNPVERNSKNKHKGKRRDGK